MMWLTSDPEACSSPAIKEAGAINAALSSDIVALSLLLSAFVIAGDAGTRANGSAWPASTVTVVSLIRHYLTCLDRIAVFLFFFFKQAMQRHVVTSLIDLPWQSHCRFQLVNIGELSPPWLAPPLSRWLFKSPISWMTPEKLRVIVSIAAERVGYLHLEENWA